MTRTARMHQLGRLACVCAAALVAVVLAAPAQAATGTDCATDGRSAADRHPRPTVRVPHTYPVEDAGPDDQVFLSESLGSDLLHTLPEAGRQGRAAAWLGASGCSGGDHNVWVAGRDGTVVVDNHYPDAPPARHLGDLAGTRLNGAVVDMAVTPTGLGYWLLGADGGVFSFGDARFHGSTGNLRLNRPIVGMATTPTGRGYWLFASDGGVFTFGDARYHGSTGGIRLDEPIIGMRPSTTGSGYWLVAADGGVFTFGDARYLGSTGTYRLDAPVAGMLTDPDGYVLVGADRKVYSFETPERRTASTSCPNGGPVADQAAARPVFPVSPTSASSTIVSVLTALDGRLHPVSVGSPALLRLPPGNPVVGGVQTRTDCTGDDRTRNLWTVTARGDVHTVNAGTGPLAGFFGDLGGRTLSAPVVGMAVTPAQRGYWLVAADGGVFTFGDARFHGSTGRLRLAQPIVGLVPTRSGQGYWLLAADGGIFTFGDARFYGSTGGTVPAPARRVVGMAVSRGGAGYWTARADGTVHGFGDAAPRPSATLPPAPVVGVVGLTRGYVLVDRHGNLR